jgi:hypothetical protein
MAEPDDLTYEISQIDLRLALVPDEDLVRCGELIEARRLLIEALGRSPAAFSDLRAIQASTVQLTARLRQQRANIVAWLGHNRRSQNLVRALSEPPASESSYFG